MPDSCKASGCPAPLAGTRVVDFSQNLAGPYGAQILGDLGADVIKVEPPGGDPARRWGPPFAGGQSMLFRAVNRNKRSVVLDLKSGCGRARAFDLAAGADVVFQALRRGAADRLGIGYGAVSAANPAVVYVSVAAYGDDGPLRDDPGYDPLMQARSGLMSVTGERGGGPVRVGASVVDLGTGVWTAVGVLAALIERSRTGRGCHVTASLLDTSLAWMSYHLASFLATGDEPAPMGTGIAMIAPYEAFPCTDGRVMIAAGNDRIFRRLCRALDLGDLAESPEYGDNAARVGNSRALAEIVAERTRRWSVAALLERLRAHKVPAAPIHGVGAALADAQTMATEMLRHPEPSEPGALPEPGCVDIAMPLRWNGARAPLRRPPPGAGEHQGELFPEDGRADGADGPDGAAAPLDPETCRGASG